MGEFATEKMGSLPGTDILPFGIKVSHTWHEVTALSRFMCLHRIKGFIELGVHVGGLAALMISRCLFDKNFRYVGVELKDEIIHPIVKEAAIYIGVRAHLMIADIYNAATKVELKKWIGFVQGSCLLYCDGGDKAKELKMYHSIIRKGDFLAAHDFTDYANPVVGLPDYHKIEGKKAPRPELFMKDVAFLSRLGFIEVDSHLAGTRIIAFNKP
jgi:hypothetical protein